MTIIAMMMKRMTKTIPPIIPASRPLPPPPEVLSTKTTKPFNYTKWGKHKMFL
jgi:hypothetical protein